MVGTEEQLDQKSGLRLYNIDFERVDFSNVVEQTAEFDDYDGSVVKYPVKTDIADGARVYTDKDGFFKMQIAQEEPRYVETSKVNLNIRGMSELAHMTDEKTGREVVAKYVDHWSVDTVKEARTMAKLSHPNIATVYDLAMSSKGRVYMLTEWIDGDSLIKWTIYPRSVEEVSDTLRQIMDGISYVNSMHMIHGDLKPENIMIDQDNRVKIIDFGISSPGEQEVLKVGSGLHSDLYAPPEQGDGYVSTRTDVYSYGAIMHDIFTRKIGAAARSARNEFRENDKLLSIDSDYEYFFHDDPAKLRKLSAVVHKALSINPTDRYANVEEMRKDLSEVFDWD